MVCKSIIFPPTRIECQIQRPSHKKNREDPENSAERMLQVLFVPRHVSFQRGHENLITLETASIAVVPLVTELPREVGHQERGVQEESEEVVEEGGGAEGGVAALVGHHPNAGQKAALEGPVQRPEEEGRGKERVVEELGEVEEEGDEGEVEGKVGGGEEEGAVEAVRGDSAFEVGEGEGRFFRWSSIFKL